MSSAMLSKSFFIKLWHLLPSNINKDEKTYIVNRLRVINAEVYTKKYKHLGECVRVGNLRNFPKPLDYTMSELELKESIILLDYRIETYYLSEARAKVYENIIEFIKQKAQIQIDNCPL